MEKIQFQHKYSIDDTVYVFSSTIMGQVKNIKYNVLEKNVEYLVEWNFNPCNYNWCREEELTDSKPF